MKILKTAYQQLSDLLIKAGTLFISDKKAGLLAHSARVNYEGHLRTFFRTEYERYEHYLQSVKGPPKYIPRDVQRRTLDEVKTTYVRNGFNTNATYEELKQKYGNIQAKGKWHQSMLREQLSPKEVLGYSRLNEGRGYFLTIKKKNSTLSVCDCNPN